MGARARIGFEESTISTVNHPPRTGLVIPPSGPVDSDVIRPGSGSLLGFGPKYSASAKLPAIERLLPNTGAKPLQGITAHIIGPSGHPVRLLVVGFDYERNRAVYFRSVEAAGPGLGTGAPAPIHVTLAGAVHGSTNAPVNYFDAPATIPFYADWCQLWLQSAVPNQPLRMNGETTAVEVGYGLYREARSAWAALFPRTKEATV